MTDHEIACGSKSGLNLKVLSQEEFKCKVDTQEEFKSKVDIFLAKCHVEVDIKMTAEQGALFREGPFRISISHAAKMKKYQDELLYCRRNPYAVLLDICVDNSWDPPEFRVVNYVPGEGFLFSVVVKDHVLVSKWRNRRPLLAADLASANFLRYLGLWFDVKNINLFFDWEQFTDEDSLAKKEDIDGHLYFMGFDVVNSEVTDDEPSNLTCELSLSPNIPLQLCKLLYVLLVSRGEKSRWLTDIDIAFFKQIFGNLEPDPLHVYNCESWKSQVVCSCKKKQYKICFTHDKYFFCHILKDNYYVDKFGPVESTLSVKSKNIKKEIDGMAKNDAKKTLRDTKPFNNEKSFGILKDIKKEKYDTKHCTENNYIKETSQETKTLTQEKSVKKFKNREKINFDPTETPVNLKFDLRSKLFGRAKAENIKNKEKVDFKISFDGNTGLSNVKSTVGSWISIDDISPPQIKMRLATTSVKRPHSIPVTTSQCKKMKLENS